MTPEERESYEGSYKRSTRTLKQINNYASEQARRTGLKMDSPEAFNTANWGYLQAWWSGYRTAMRVTMDITK